jgi:hypothetical protein
LEGLPQEAAQRCKGHQTVLIFIASKLAAFLRWVKSTWITDIRENVESRPAAEQFRWLPLIVRSGSVGRRLIQGMEHLDLPRDILA